MKSIFIFIAFYILLTSSPACVSNVIDPEDLFSDSDIFSLKISPNSSFIAGHINLGGEALGVFDRHSLRFKSIIKFDRKYLDLSSYGWIDKDTLYFDYRDSRSGWSKHGIVNVKISGKDIDFDVSYIEQDGYVVDYLEDVDSTFLFSRKFGSDPGKQKLHILTVKQFLEGDFSNGNRFKTELEGGLNYIWDDRGRALIAQAWSGDNLETWVLSDGAEKWESVYRVESFNEVFTPILMLDQSKMVVLSNRFTDTVSLVVFDLNKKGIEKVLYRHERYDLVDAEVMIGSEGEDLYLKSVSYFDHGRLSVKYFLEDDAREMAGIKAAFSGKQVVVASQGLNGREKIFLVSSSSDPGAFYFFDPDLRDAKLIGDLHSDIDISLLSESKALVSQVEDGSLVESILTEPRSRSNGVLLVMPHGGPIGVRDYLSFNPEVQYLASRGFSVLQVNFRGSSGFGKTFLEDGVAQWGKAIERDISSVVDQLLREKKYENICSIGTSYGGYSSLMLAIENPETYDCAVAMYGVFDLPLLFNSSNLKRDGKYLSKLVSVVGELDVSMKDKSPFRLADKIKVPVLLVAGKQDNVSGFEQVNRMKYMLHRYGADVEFLAYENVGHGHQSWHGERHQAALVNEFLVRKLNLPVQDFVNQEIRREENLLLADEFWFGGLVEKDIKLAVGYYRKAAELGSGRAMYSLANYYRRPGVEQDLGMAEDWFRRAGIQGYSEAPYWLARHAESGVFTDLVGRDILDLYVRSDELGHPYAYLDVARLHCAGGIGFDQNIARCIQLLVSDSRKFDGSGRRNDGKERTQLDAQKKRVLAQMIGSEKLDGQAQEVVKKVLSESYSVNAFELDMDLEDYGIVLPKPSYDGEFYFDSETVQIDLRKHRSFGVRVRARDLVFSGSAEAKAAVVLKWSFPPQKDPHGNVRTEEVHLDFLSSDMDSLYFYRFDEEWEKVPGKWKVEFLAVDGTQLAVKEFTVFSAGNTGVH